MKKQYIKHSKIQEKQEKSNAKFGKEISNLINKFRLINPSYQSFHTNFVQRACLRRLILTHTSKKVENMINYAYKVQGEQYAPVITSPTELEEKLAKLRAYKLRKETNVPNDKLVSPDIKEIIKETNSIIKEQMIKITEIHLRLLQIEEKLMKGHE